MVYIGFPAPGDKPSLGAHTQPVRGSRGVQRSGDARGDCLVGCPLPNSSIEQWRMVVIVTRYTLFVSSQYDVIFTFAIQNSGEVCWHNVQIQGRWNSGRAGGTVKELRAMQSYKKQKNHYQLCLFLFISNVDLKNNTRNYRKSFWIFWVPG